MALAERTIAEALRVFAPRDVAHRDVAHRGRADSLRHGPATPRDGGESDEMLALVDEQTLTGEPHANAVLVYGPAPLLLDTLRVDVTPEDWHMLVHADEGTVREHLSVGAMRGGVLVALATASQPLGRLSKLRVLVSPAFRQIGLGHLVLHRTVQSVLRDGLIPYATLVSTDLGARALARAVGFVNVSRAFGGLTPAF